MDKDFIQDNINIEYKNITRFKLTIYKDATALIAIPTGMQKTKDADYWIANCQNIFNVIGKNDYSLRATYIPNNKDAAIDIFRHVKFGKSNHKVKMYEFDIVSNSLYKVSNDE